MSATAGYILRLMKRIGAMNRGAYFPLALEVLCAPVLIAAHDKPFGWAMLALALIFARLQPARIMHELWAIGLALFVLSVTPVNTSLALGHFLIAIPLMGLAVAIPNILLEQRHHYRIILYKLRHGRRWYWQEMLYIVVPALIGYLLLPIYFRTTGQYLHWHVALGASNLTVFLIGLIIVGIWDEVFFVATMAAILRQRLPFWLANLAQAVIFSSFLYELGFRSWGVIFSYLFALVQCYIFKVTNSLIYAATIHVVFDVMLFLALVHAYYPSSLPIFLIH